MKLKTMCLNKMVSTCENCKEFYALTYHKCVRLADRKHRRLEIFAKELYCDNIDLMVIIESLEQKDQDLYNEITKFMDGEN